MKTFIAVAMSGCISLAHAGMVRSQSDVKDKIESVSFSGNESYPAERLHGVMLSRPSSFFRPSYYYPEVFDLDLKNLRLFYNQQGYLEATIDTYDVVTDTVDRRTVITIRLSEGMRTFVEGIGLFGNRFFSDEKLMSLLRFRVGDPLLQKNIEQSIIALLTHYANHGFLDAQIEPSVRVSTERHRAIIDFTVTEGRQFRIGQVLIAGIEKTKERVIRRELRFRSSEVIDYSRLLTSQRRLYLTGLFQSVFIRPVTTVDDDSSLKDIRVELKENMSGEFNVSVGYGSVEKARGKIEIYNHNLRGTARQVGLVLKGSFINRRGELSFTEPWTLGTRWKTDINAALEYNEEPGYHLNSVGGQFMLGRHFLKRSNLTLAFRREHVRLSEITVSQIPDRLKTNTNSLKLSVILDTRDNLFNSTRGVYLEWSPEVGRFFYVESRDFLRLTVRCTYFRPFGRGTVVGTGIEARWIDARGGLESIPLHERFYAGGPNVLRGFAYRKVGPLDEDGTPMGGRLKFTWNLLEIRRTVYRMVGMTFFTDIGTVWKNAEDARIADLRLSPGIGLRVNTPIGLVRLDMGINANPRAGEPGWKLYFNMGQAF